MAEFEKLQELWQQQPQPRMVSTDAAALTRAFAKYGRRQDWVNGAKLALIVMVIGWELRHLHWSAMALGGLAVVAAVAGTLLTMDCRSQRVISRLNFAEPSAAFVRSAIDRLMERRDPFRKYYWPFMLTLVAAVNLMFWNTLASSPAAWRYTWHFVDSALPFAAYEAGRRIRIKRFEMECRPLAASIVFAAEASAASGSPSFLAGVPGVAASFLYSAMISALPSLKASLSSHSTLSASRPFFADQKFSASTATPCGIATTSITPLTAFVLEASNDLTLPPKRGGCATFG